MYKVSYAQVNNAGDLLNIYIMKNIFGIEIICSNPYFAQISGIGSHLSLFQKSNNAKAKIFQHIFSKKKVNIWGTGFLNYEKSTEPLFFKQHIVFNAVRGNLTKKRVEKLVGKKLEIPVCDGGILTSLMFSKPLEKKHEVGIIPHYKEQNSSWFEKLKCLSNKSIIIDLKANPMDVYKTIGSCEYVISSSLHGLIIADSFGIPNLHVKVTDNMLGDGFKFSDYYSGYNIQDTPFVLKKNTSLPSINDIIDRYAITTTMVNNKQKQMLECFPIQQFRRV